MTALITLFSAPKPFEDAHISQIQHNALRSWQALGEQVAVVIVGEGKGIPEAAAKYGFHYRPDVRVNHLGTPLISSIFELGRQANQSPFLAYVNADIILFQDILPITQTVARQSEKFLMIGQRWDLDVREDLVFEGDWVQALKAFMRQNGKLHSRTGSDYFIFPRACFEHIPDFTVGRAGWDNWMIYQARRQGWDAIDCSVDLEIIHQNHDYRHLPGGQPHYRLPETGENILLAGGRRTIFELDDANLRLVNGKLEPMPQTRRRKWREWQNRPLLRHGSYGCTQLRFMLLHPKKAWAEFWKNRAMAKTMRAAQKNDGQKGKA